MLVQVNLLSLLLSPVLFFIVGSVLFLLLTHLKMIRTKA
ncbi:hypothetical protein GPUN_2142 [Glaciecola punicea ACAM 611]|uniref:Uncharacterized protein n=1 Tax=Glaciecola punicea ACAM 611 TaxID=1121923 RepID=H5TD80_9ALTE|nr:hypothetical protein GPUN_2142 [Glaciecola punicea ACAM 611]